ncbi:RcnB family protein [Sphingomonas profundi]|uniref:RcnB family protein n=1 Tax=Alterirhizorhabdus profundi TaxID=2681549 RepID=UPI0018D170AC|nr:RcnB family protein [Sphingomonas profundi]
MVSLGKVWLALSLAACAAGAHAAVDSLPGGVPADTPVEPAGRAVPPAAGSWTRDGWSDAARGPASRAPIAQPVAPPPAAQPPVARARPVAMRDDAPPPDAYRDRGPGADRAPGGPRDGWRRQTWDGGRGNGFRYRRGGRLPGVFASPRYVVRDWDGYDLPPPGPGRDWVRYYDDAVLVDRGGYVIDAVPDIGWDDFGPRPGRDPHFAYDEDAYRDTDPRWHGGGATYDRPDCRGVPYGHPCVTYGPGGATTVVVTTAPSVTKTTTVTESYVTTSRPRHVATRHRPAAKSKLLRRGR